EDVTQTAVCGECACLFQMGKPREACAVLRRRLSTRSDRGWAERLLGHYLLASGDAEGYAHLRRALALDPADSHAAIEWAAWSYHVQPAPDPAPALRSVVAAHPRHAQVWALLGGLASRRRDYVEAARAWGAAREIRP